MSTTLTPRQLREVNTALRHLGRAMAALDRAQLPQVPPAGNYVEWLFDLHRGEQRTASASNSLIDGLEAYAPGDRT